MILRNITFRKLYIAALVLGAVSIIGIVLTKSLLPPVVPLFYGKPVGAEQLAKQMFMIMVPGVSILISIVNIFISKTLEDEFLKKILAISSFVIALMSMITITKIILLVGFF